MNFGSHRLLLTSDFLLWRSSSTFRSASARCGFSFIMLSELWNKRVQYFERKKMLTGVINTIHILFFCVCSCGPAFQPLRFLAQKGSSRAINRRENFGPAIYTSDPKHGFSDVYFIVLVRKQWNGIIPHPYEEIN